MWRCPDCGAYVGCHPGTEEPLGRLANAELRYWKKLAHDAFDLLWKDGVINKIWPKYIKGITNRTKAYIWLSNKLGIPKERMHIGMLNIEDCKRVVEICKIKEDEHTCT